MIYYGHTKFSTRLACSFLGAVTCIGALSTVPIPSFASYNGLADGEAPDKASGGGGHRGRGSGCSETEDGLGLTLLAPQEHVGQTVSSYPTFVWYVPTDQPLEGGIRIMTLTENGEPDEILEEYLFPSSQGFMAFTLPESAEPLESGERYLWQVYLECDSRSTNDDFAEVAVDIVNAERVPSPLSTDPVEQAKQFAEAGLWYDALATLLAVENNAEARIYRDQLLLDLANLEGTEGTENSDSVAPESSELSFSESLQQIVQ